MTFLEALQRSKNSKRNIVIPDIKRFSPKEGELLGERDPVELARTLVASGAPALSVVTEEKEFHGSMELLRRVCAGAGVPVLRKDFVQSRAELEATKAAGASAVLLMYACLTPDRLAALYGEARELGLDALVETHTAEEMELARSLGARLIGINNRDIRSLERDDGTVRLTGALARRKPGGAFLVSESSLLTPDDVRRAAAADADAALVGTAILRAGDPAAFYRRLCRRTGVKLCGMTDERGAALCLGAAPDVLGFVVEYPENVPWNLTAERAKPLLALAGRRTRTCVVTGGRPDKVIKLAEALRPDLVQLHHREDLAQTIEIARALSKMGMGVIRTIPVTAAEREAQFGVLDPDRLSRLMAEAGVIALLTDARGPSNAAAGGAAPVEEFRSLRAASPLPVILAGGITPDNAAALIKKSGAEHIDVMTGIENAPGVKSHEKLERLMRAVEGDAQ